MGALREAPGQLALFLGTYLGNLGLGWFDEDYVDGSGGHPPTLVERMLGEASYSSSYFEPALAAARALGVVETTGVYALCDHVFDRAPGAIPNHPGSFFLGNFAFDHDAHRARWPRELRDRLELDARARARVWVDAFEPSAIARFAQCSGWSEDDVRSAALPMEVLRDTSPARAAEYVEELRRDGHAARAEIVRAASPVRASRIDRIVRGAEESMRGEGESIEGLVVRARRPVRFSASAAAALRDAAARPSGATILRELGEKLSDEYPGRDDEEVKWTGLCVVDAGRKLVVLDRDRPSRVWGVAVLPRLRKKAVLRRP